VGGLLIHQLGRVPQVTDCIIFNNLEFKVIAADERRVKKIQVQQLAPTPAGQLSSELA
jgi:CBS domain containing-hemolysin-like protein